MKKIIIKVGKQVVKIREPIPPTQVIESRKVKESRRPKHKPDYFNE